MLQNACEDKGSAFLRVSMICNAIFINAALVGVASKARFAWKSVAISDYSFRKV